MRASGAQAHINARLDIVKILRAPAQSRKQTRVHGRAHTQMSYADKQNDYADARAGVDEHARWPTENSRLWSQQEQDVLGARA